MPISLVRFCRSALRRFLGLAFLSLALQSSVQADDPAPAAPSKPVPHLVFAHYMLCYFSSVDFYKREIELAQRHGIDGFALNSGMWKGSPYHDAADKMYEAAKQLNSGFKIFESADISGPAASLDNMEDMVTVFGKHPNQLMLDDRPVLSTWGGNAQYFSSPTLLPSLKAKGVSFAFVPNTFQLGFSANWSERTVRDFFSPPTSLDGIFLFGPDMTPAELIRSNANSRQATSELGKIYMAGNTPAYNSANLRDFQGTRGYEAVWEGIINDNADWVEVVTWNDYNEDSNLNPFRWGGETAYWSRDEVFLDVTDYYAKWFKSGVKPDITQDKFYYTYRNRSKKQTMAWDEKKAAWVDFTKDGGSFPVVDQIHDDVVDDIYVTTFLTAPADLVVTIGDKKHSFKQSAGIAYAAMPMSPGTPHFELQRDGKPLIAVDGRKEIIGEATKENSPNGYHLLNRTWTGGAAAGTAIKLDAANATIAGTATKQDKGVLVPTAKGAGFSLPVSGLKTSTYNVRVTYHNPTKAEARLMLSADGPPTDAGTVAYSMPLFFPPTDGSAKTISFLWSLFDNTTKLSVDCQVPDKVEPQTPFQSDMGGVVIDGFELIPVNGVPVVLPAVHTRPVMVAIPGGSFKMGKADGEPNQKPVRDVTLSPFAIGKYEITNAEFERFRPDHKKNRDSFSWRDSDPVVYVSWNDCAKYCNTLSAQAGLDPAYDEKTWALKAGSNGIRLVSEAQWEYVASGRGENRVYPWGNEPPTPDRGNFALEQALDVDAAVRGQGAQHPSPVGAFPKGASKDGVMDMAGNVAEWCADAYDVVPAQAGTDPLIDTASPYYRSIRGGSWGYYNYHQEVARREFNNPGYPGYIYLGFRIAVPQAGWDKIKDKP